MQNIKQIKNSKDNNYIFKTSLNDQTELYEKISNNKDQHVYALISYHISSNNKNFETIHILYLLNIKDFTLENLFISHCNFTANDVKKLLCKVNLPENSIVLTLNYSPFTTYIITETLKEKNLKQFFYNKKHFTPTIDKSKLFLQTMISITLFNKKSINYNDIQNITKLWNEEVKPLITKIALLNKHTPNKLYFK